MVCWVDVPLTAAPMLSIGVQTDEASAQPAEHRSVGIQAGFSAFWRPIHAWPPSHVALRTAPSSEGLTSEEWEELLNLSGWVLELHSIPILMTHQQGWQADLCWRLAGRRLRWPFSFLVYGLDAALSADALPGSNQAGTPRATALQEPEHHLGNLNHRSGYSLTYSPGASEQPIYTLSVRLSNDVLVPWIDRDSRGTLPLDGPPLLEPMAVQDRGRLDEEGRQHVAGRAAAAGNSANSQRASFC